MSEEIDMNLKDKIRTVPNWPIEGVMFRDITTLLEDPEAFKMACLLISCDAGIFRKDRKSGL